jgi:hypothetical protein
MMLRMERIEQLKTSVHKYEEKIEYVQFLNIHFELSMSHFRMHKRNIAMIEMGQKDDELLRDAALVARGRGDDANGIRVRARVSRRGGTHDAFLPE